MREDVKKILVIAAASFVLFWLLKPKKTDTKKLFVSKSDDTDFIKKPMLSDDDLQHEHLRLSYDALCAYIDAHNAGASKTAMQEIKNGFKQQIGIEIYTDANNKLAVRDIEGNDILVN